MLVSKQASNLTTQHFLVIVKTVYFAWYYDMRLTCTSCMLPCVGRYDDCSGAIRLHAMMHILIHTYIHTYINIPYRRLSWNSINYKLDESVTFYLWPILQPATRGNWDIQASLKSPMYHIHYRPIGRSCHKHMHSYVLIRRKIMKELLPFHLLICAFIFK